jgi:hypothetical protein
MADDGNLLGYSSAFGLPTAAPDNSLYAFDVPGLTPGASVPPPPPAVAAAPGAPLTGSSYASGIAAHESGGDPNAQNPYFPVSRGGPLGTHQFVADTWKSFAKANPALFDGMTPDQVLAARSNPQLSEMATHWYAGVNAPTLQAAGIVPSPDNLAIAHAFGGKGAVGVLRYPDSTTLTDALKASQPDKAAAILAQNPTYQRMTVGDLRTKYAGMGGSVPTPAAPVATAAVSPSAAAVAPNAMSSLAPYSSANLAAMSPFNRLVAMQQLRSLFTPPAARQQVAQAAAGPQTGGVDASIPLMAGRV